MSPDNLPQDGVDVIRAEMHHPSLHGDTLSLPSAAKLIRGVQVMIQAAAWAAVTPSGILEGQKPALLSKYIKAIQLGQTESSPFAISVLSPLSAEFDSPDDDKPYSRLAIETLATALQALINFTASPDWEEDGIFGLVKAGVSANLCAGAAAVIQSIGKRSGKKRTSMDGNMKAVRLAFDWSPSLSVPAGTPKAVILEPDMFETIKQLESTLKSFVREDFEFEGYVTQFAVGQGDKAGKIVIERVADDKPARFLLEVSEAEYDRAIDALRDKAMINGTGTLVRNGSQFMVADLKEFGIEQPVN